MNEPSLLLGDLAVGRGFVLALVGALAVAVALRIVIHRRIEERFVAVTGAIERWILTGLLLSLVGLSAFQIIYRNVFGSGFVWIDPFLRNLVLWLTFLGAFAATAQGRHIGIDIVGRLLPARPRLVLTRALSVMAAGVCVALSNGAYEYLSLERGFVADAFLGIPTWQAQFILLLGFVLLAYRFLVAAVFGIDPAEETGAPIAEVRADGGDPSPPGPGPEATSR